MTLSHRATVGIAEQSVVGTGVNPTILVPHTSFSLSENNEQLRDSGRRGPDSMDFRAVQGIGWSEISVEGNVQTHLNTGMPVGVFARNILASGGAYTVTQIPTASGVYNHDRVLGTTKEYITLEHGALGGANDRRAIGCRVSELTFRYNAAEGFVNYAATLTGRKTSLVTLTSLSGQVTNPEDPFRSWQAELVVNGVANFARLISAEWTLSRNVTRLYTGDNSQDFADIYLGPLEVTCSLVFDYTVVTDIAMFRAKTQGSLLTSFTFGTEGVSDRRGFEIGGILFDFGDGPAEIDASGDNMTLALTARGLYSTGNSPITGNPATIAQNGPIHIRTKETQAAAY